MPIQDVSDLRVYQLALQLLKKAYSLASLIENDRVMTNNLRKTAAQIAPQIAEGYGKKASPREFKRYLEMAMGTSDEMVTHLQQVKLVCNVPQEGIDKFIEHYRSLSKQINSLIKKWT